MRLTEIGFPVTESGARSATGGLTNGACCDHGAGTYGGGTNGRGKDGGGKDSEGRGGGGKDGGRKDGPGKDGSPEMCEVRGSVDRDMGW